jgi:hypothetical protein
MDRRYCRRFRIKDDFLKLSARDAKRKCAAHVYSHAAVREMRPDNIPAACTVLACVTTHPRSDRRRNNSPSDMDKN